MKIATLSLNVNTDDLNFGAVMHSYSFQQVLIKLGYTDTEIINYIPQKVEHINRKYPLFTSFKKFTVIKFGMSILTFFSHAKKYDKFEKFINTNMKLSSQSFTQEQLNNAELPYDCIICESDVIWSPGFFNGGFDKAFFMALDSMKECKKIAYSASLANGDFNEKQDKEFAKLLENVDFISCREKYGVDLTKEHTTKDVAHVLDPTLLLKEADYTHLLKKSSIDDKYILIYFPLSYNKALVNLAKKYAKKHNYKTIEISNYVWEKFSHKTYCSAGIEDFLTLIKNAECIFTNSLHAVCFSIIFHRPFYGFARATGRKTEDLLESLNLSDRYIKDNNFIEGNDINYNEVDKILDDRIDYSMNWLKNALAK
ncbi:hypothetical protein M2475_000908 [Breznakia sp. PF5-3]|uniref:polysaccharide pyruvyl transferase family protein n=1 Tax=unclassified Breznakia TaxID=2623764 RepID=UPI002405250D|nr:MULTISPECIES: polysaccharide pyruvyl transferase family protein [unclassified Breznakia]MDF9824680.1 hypothetical protein [Breznakia sp. PM6-1]MDF9835343.1 hypothetical protein [Breznakia sp. PF5-3]MDF9836942.1 hypothetical protein [Breznakia sp. PFB2-8]MDF9859578.1 hypothetical protein [Breznakia sp. PH5-24]